MASVEKWGILFRSRGWACLKELLLPYECLQSTTESLFVYFECVFRLQLDVVETWKRWEKGKKKQTAISKMRCRNGRKVVAPKPEFLLFCAQERFKHRQWREWRRNQWDTALIVNNASPASASHGHSDHHRQALERHLPAVHMRCTSSRSMASLFFLLFLLSLLPSNAPSTLTQSLIFICCCGVFSSTSSVCIV